MQDILIILPDTEIPVIADRQEQWEMRNILYVFYQRRCLQESYFYFSYYKICGSFKLSLKYLDLILLNNFDFGNENHTGIEKVFCNLVLVKTAKQVKFFFTYFPLVSDTVLLFYFRAFYLHNSLPNPAWSRSLIGDDLLIL